MNALPPAYLAFSIFPMLLTVAALKDLSSYTIPNWISATLLVTFVPVALVAGLPWQMAAQHAAVGGVALLIGMAMFALNWMGGGDAKLFSAAALWLGLPAAPAFLLWTAIAGGVLTLTLIGARRAYAFQPIAGGPVWLHTLLSPKSDVPYGVALAAGALLAFPGSGLVQAAF
jgi:prepilin peptidase CpaA